MYQTPVLFPAASNRETWQQTVQIYDDDTGDLISLVDGSGVPLYSVYLEISGPSSYGYNPSYSSSYYDSCSSDPMIVATLANYISIVDSGTIYIQIPYTVMQSLRGRKTYNVYLRIEDTANADARQILIGTLPVAFGGHGT